MTLVFEDPNSKLLDVVSVADVWSRFWTLILVTILKITNIYRLRWWKVLSVIYCCVSIPTMMNESPILTKVSIPLSLHCSKIWFYDNIADVAESSLQLMSDFQNGSRVLKKMLSISIAHNVISRQNFAKHNFENRWFCYVIWLLSSEITKITKKMGRLIAICSTW